MIEAFIAWTTKTVLGVIFAVVIVVAVLSLGSTLSGHAGLHNAVCSHLEICDSQHP